MANIGKLLRSGRRLTADLQDRRRIRQRPCLNWEERVVLRLDRRREKDDNYRQANEFC